MSDKWMPPDLDDFVRRYLSGESLKALAARYGVSRTPIAARLIEQGITIRGYAAANKLRCTAMSPEQHRRNAEAAHAAVRGVRQTWEHQCKIALARQERLSHVSPAELLLAEWLKNRGIEITPQLAVGAYNVDLGTFPVAVEIFGGGWHAFGRHRKRAPERYRYLLDQGWSLIIVWVYDGRRGAALTPAVADYITTFCERTSTDPTFRREYRVIWGDGKEVPPSSLDLNHLSDIPSRRAARRAGSAHHDASGETAGV